MSNSTRKFFNVSLVNFCFCWLCFLGGYAQKMVPTSISWSSSSKSSSNSVVSFTACICAFHSFWVNSMYGKRWCVLRGWQCWILFLYVWVLLFEEATSSSLSIPDIFVKKSLIVLVTFGLLILVCWSESVFTSILCCMSKYSFALLKGKNTLKKKQKLLKKGSKVVYQLEELCVSPELQRKNRALW